MIDREGASSTAYAAPETVDAALRLLAASDDARLIAGGQSLLVFMRQGLLQPALLIGLKKIPELRRLDVLADGGLIVGAMVTQRAIAASPAIVQRFPALAEAAALVASPLVRNQGTIGGNLCHADPTADPPAALIALGADVEIASVADRRRILVESLFADYMETVLGSAEILTAIHLPPPLHHVGAAYVKHRLRGVDTALVGAGVGITLSEDESVIVDARIGLAGGGVTPLRLYAAEEMLRGQPATGETLAAAAVTAAGECEPLADTEGSEWYRREMVAVFVRRAAERALQRARSGRNDD